MPGDRLLGIVDAGRGERQLGWRFWFAQACSEPMRCIAKGRIGRGQGVPAKGRAQVKWRAHDDDTLLALLALLLRACSG